jgi:hypothetical protein
MLVAAESTAAQAHFAIVKHHEIEKPLAGNHDFLGTLTHSHDALEIVLRYLHPVVVG